MNKQGPEVGGHRAGRLRRRAWRMSGRSDSADGGSREVRFTAKNMAYPL